MLVVLSVSVKEYFEKYKPETRTEPPTFCLYCMSAPRHFTKKVAYINFLCTSFSLADKLYSISFNTIQKSKINTSTI
jgi:hypothetical protein